MTGDASEAAVRLVAVPKPSFEFRQLSKAFVESTKRCDPHTPNSSRLKGCTRVEVESIERVQNSALWTRYQLNRQLMMKKLGVDASSDGEVDWVVRLARTVLRTIENVEIDDELKRLAREELRLVGGALVRRVDACDDDADAVTAAIFQLREYEFLLADARSRP